MSMSKKITNQNIVDIARYPDRGITLRVYNNNVSRIKDSIAMGFRKYLDQFPSQMYTEDSDFVFDVPVTIYQRNTNSSGRNF